jgi:hypothetical protein
MADINPDDQVCRHCGGETELRHGDFGDRIHKRQRPRVTPVCTRTPELILRAEYEAMKAAGASQENN